VVGQVHDLLHYILDWLRFGRDLLRLSTGVEGLLPPPPVPTFLSPPPPTLPSHPRESIGVLTSSPGFCFRHPGGTDAGEDSHQQRARLMYEMSSGCREDELKLNMRRGVVSSLLQAGVSGIGVYASHWECCAVS
jgi:hypothetical protein